MKKGKKRGRHLVARYSTVDSYSPSGVKQAMERSTSTANR
jgi:hypothetical protein